MSDEPAREETDVVMEGLGGRLEDDTDTAGHALEIAVHLTPRLCLRLQVLPVSHASMVTVTTGQDPQYLLICSTHGDLFTNIVKILLFTISFAP